MSSLQRITLVLTLLALPVALVAQGRSPQALARLQDSVQAAGGRVIILLKPTNPGMVVAGASPVGLLEFNQIGSRIESVGQVSLTGSVQRFGTLFATTTPAGLAELNNDPNIALIEPDLFVPIDTDTDTWSAYRPSGMAQTTPWGISRVLAPESWAMTNGGAGVKVGVMDSGGDPNHEDLVYAGGFNAKTNGTTSAAWADDLTECKGHGTHVAGTIAARNNSVGVVGVAPNVSLYALKVMEVQNGQCGALISSQVKALNWAVSNGIRVVNASLSAATSNTSMQVAVENAAANGTLFVASSGNSSAAAVNFPAAYPHAIAVGSIDDNNNRASSSNYGPELWVVAPGVNVESTMPGGGYGLKSGTSMATPHVTGIVALLLAQTPGLSLDQARAKLKSGAQHLGNQTTTAWGLARAYQSLGGGVAPPPPPPAPLPLAVSVSASSRSGSTQINTPAPKDSAGVTLTGDGAANAAWSASKRKSWTTLTTASGNGNGLVRWNRNSAGLAVGTHVDTITVTAGSSTTRIIDTLVITPAPVPLSVGLSASSRTSSTQINTSAPKDSAAVILAGDGAANASWSASKRKGWTTLTTASGTGNGMVRWNRSTGSLPVGIYVDTITISASGTSARLIDTLVITAAPVPLALSVAPGSRSDAAQINTSAPKDSAAVALTGDGAASTAWSATKRKGWTTLTTTNGTGNGMVRWNRNSAGLAVGTYVDTITVIAGSTSARVIDTLVITAAPVPLALSLSATSRAGSAQINTAAPKDSVGVSLTGDGAASTAWSATKRKGWTTLTTANGTGNGMVRWNRNTGSLPVGVYVDTITISASGTTARVIDTLVITAAPVPLALSVAPGSRFDAVQINTSSPKDSAAVSLTGDGATSAAWSATKRKGWTTLTTANGTGNGMVRWNRNSAGLAVGTYVDTITVTAGAATSRVIDTLVITAAPVPLAVSVAPGSRFDATQINTSAPKDSAAVSLTGDGATSAAWSATKRKGWTTLTTASGTGNGMVRWNRNSAGLAVGTYVDTITVTAGAATSRVIDTLVITAAPVPLAVSLSAASRSGSAQINTAAPKDSVAVLLTGDGAAGATWTATKQKGWTTLITAGGTGNGMVRWSRSTSGLAVGIHVDTITVMAGSATSRVIDTLVITAAPVPLTMTVSPTSRRALAQVGTAAPSDMAAITLAGDGSAIAGWSASVRKPWTTLTAAAGKGSGQVTWNRSTTGLAVGTYVDTITVTADGATGSPRMVIDTLVVTAAPVPLAVSLAPTARRVTIQQGQAAGNDQAAVAFSGDGAGSASWTVTRRKSWTSLGTTQGAGDGLVSWTRATTALPVGVHVDTITVQVVGQPGVRAMLLDTIEVTAPPVPLVVVVSPGARRVTHVVGNVVQQDSAMVTLSGADAGAATWTATKRKSWNTLQVASGKAGSWVRWTRRTNGLTAGTYVDTIAIALAGVPKATIYDTLVITPAAAPSWTIAIRPRGRSWRMVHSAGFYAVASAEAVRDSAVVEGDGSTEMLGMAWEASTTSPRLRVVVSAGNVGSRVVWEQVPTALAVGRHIDSIRVRLIGQETEAYFVDTLVVAEVSAPTPTVAVNQLLKGSGLTQDQQLLLDQVGNRNGRYDLGDFLAWVERGGIAVSPAIMQQLMALPEAKATQQTSGGGGGGGTP